MTEPMSLSVEGFAVIAALAAGRHDAARPADAVPAWWLDDAGEALSEPARRLLAGYLTAVAFTSIRTIRPTVVADLDLCLGRREATALEQVGDEILVSTLQTSVAPVRAAEQLGLGPRGVPGVDTLSVEGRHLLIALAVGDAELATGAVLRLAGSLTSDDAALRDALRAGEWRLSQIQVRANGPGGPDVPVVATVALLDTPAGLFGVNHTGDIEAIQLMPLAAADVWERLSAMTTLAGIASLAVGHHDGTRE